MDGQLTVQELWEKTVERFGDDGPSQGEIIRVLSQLHAADVLLCDVPPDTGELLSRHEKSKKSKWKLILRSPLALRFPLLDPERFLSASIGFVRPFFSLIGAVIWLAVVGSAIVLGVQHWPELTRNVADRMLSAQNLVLLWLIYPVVKALHEFGHAYAVKRWGGEVHEMGIMLLVLMPIPYVDASSSLALPQKWKRVLVSASGMMTELFVAALALFLWLNLGQGVARSIAYNVIFIASVSTVLFNANPLLRYDGYYILSDVLEIPNLAQRSVNYLGYLFRRYMFGLKRAAKPHTGPGERFWLTVYAVSSFFYRIFIYAAIILFISGKFFIVGVMLGIWGFFSMVVVPIGKRINFVVFSPVVREKRFRAVVSSLALVVVVLAVLFLVPFPSWTRAEGVVWAPEESLVRAGTSCFIEHVAATPNKEVKRDGVLIECSDPLMVAKARVLKAELRALEAQYDAEIIHDRVRAKITKEEIVKVQRNLSREEQRMGELSIKSPTDGVFVVPGAEDLPGRFLRQGDLVAYVLDVEEPIVRVVVSEADVDLIRQRNGGIAIRFSERLDQVYQADIRREVPGAIESLPSTVLGSAGGGEVAIDPWDKRGLKPLEKLFQFDLELDGTVGPANVGGRVYVRFDHGSEPIALQWYRSLRQLFMRRFNV
jgi:putative peptide zinc metalloprotease protein